VDNILFPRPLLKLDILFTRITHRKISSTSSNQKKAASIKTAIQTLPVGIDMEERTPFES
jgi:hypothetical protein